MRWKLTEPHYLNVPETTWEQKETDRMTGKQVRKAYPVPLYLNPKEESDWNYQSIDSSMERAMVVSCRGWKVSTITASSSVRSAPRLFSTAPGCGPCGMPRGWSVIEDRSIPRRLPKLPLT